MSFWRLICVLPLLLSCQVEHQAVADGRSAADILKATREAYSSAESYRDSGYVVLDEPLVWKAVQLLTHRETRDHFTTTLARGRGGSFDYQSRDSDRHHARLSTETLDQLDALTGVTRGVSLIIPPLLLGSNRWPRTVAQIRRETDAETAGHDCFRVVADDGYGRVQRIWIEKESLLIRRVETRMHTKGLDSTHTVVYQTVDLRTKADR